PLMAGPKKDPGDTNNPDNQGSVQLTQDFTILANTTQLVTAVAFNIPPGAQITDVLIHVLTMVNSATSAPLSIGSASCGTQYVSGVNVKAATGRLTPTYTAAQLAAMAGVSTAGAAAPIAGPVFIDITSVGQPSAGVVQVTVRYLQNPV